MEKNNVHESLQNVLSTVKMLAQRHHEKEKDGHLRDCSDKNVKFASTVQMRVVRDTVIGIIISILCNCGFLEASTAQ